MPSALAVCTSSMAAAPVQMRLKISVPRLVTTRPFGPTDLVVHVTAAAPWPMARPDQTTVPPQSDVHVLEVVNATRRCGS
jgi:hypothetical protein